MSRLAGCMMLLAMVASAVAAEDVRVGFYENRPKIYTSEQGEPTGFFPELIEAIAEKEGWTLHYVAGGWQECLDRLEKGELDIMPDVALTPERQALFVFGDETALISWASVYTRPGENIASFFDLSGKRVALLRGSVYDKGRSSLRAIMEQFNIPAEFIECESYADVFASVERGDADAGVVNNIFGSTEDKHYKVSRTPIVFSPSRLHFAFPKGGARTAAFKAATDRHLRELKADQESVYYEAIDAHLYGLPRQAKESDGGQEALTAEEQEWLRAHPHIRLGFDPEFFPFEFLDDAGHYAGIASDYVQVLAEQYGIRLEPLPHLEWSEVMERVARREVDVLSCVGQSDERAAYLLFSKPYIEFQRVIITRDDMPFITGISDIGNLRVGVQASSSHEAFLREKTGLSFTSYKTVKDLVMALSSGHIDAVVGNVASCAFWIRRLNLTNLKIAAPASPETFTLHFAVRRDWPELVGIINKCLDQINETTRSEIRQRWVGLEYEAEFSSRAAWRAMIRTTLIAAVVLAAVLLWLWRLKREITLRKHAETELIRYAEEMKKANVKLEDMDRLKNMFIASVSHELRTPLNSIIGFSGVLLKGMTGELNDKQKDQLGRIYHSAQHLLSLITDIIDISKIEAGRMDVYAKPFQLAELINECADAIQPQLSAKPLTLSVDVPADLPLCTDRKRLRQCLLNYLSNAVKYSEQGTISVTSRRLPEGWVEISVADTGIGIAEEDLARLFQPFERMDSHLRVKAGGTGLGLYLTRKIAMEILRGDIAVKSVKGKGSAFSLIIPTHLDPAEIRTADGGANDNEKGTT